MAFGMKLSTGDFLPICKYDARAGKFLKVDKRPDGGEDIAELPLGTSFAIDFGTFEAGYMTIGPQGPVRLMKPYSEGAEMPPQPQERDDKGNLAMKPGFRAVIAGNAIGGVREWCSNAAAVVGPVDELWQKWWHAPEAAQGKVPLIAIVATAPRTTGGKQKSTNYVPSFEIKGWIDRIEQFGKRTVPIPGEHAGNGNGTHQTAEPAKTAGPAPVAASTAAPQASKPDGMPF